MDDHIRATTALIAQVVESHHSIVLWISGGKDSTTLAHLARPWAHRIQLVSVVMDGGFEGIEEHIDRCAAIWGYAAVDKIAPPLTFAQYTERFGWPSHLLPTTMDGVLPDPFSVPGPKLASWWHCSIVRVLTPLMQASKALGAEAVLTAARRSDAPVHGRLGKVIDASALAMAGWVRYDPMHDWSTAQVYDYLQAHQIALHALGDAKRQEQSFEFPDCVLCPYNAPYVRWLRDHRPEDYATMQQGFGPALAALRQQAQTELSSWEDVWAQDSPQD